MDLKDVIAKVNEVAMEAHNAFHAGHQDVAEAYLRKSLDQIQMYFDEQTKPAGDVTESATSEKSAETLPETPAEVPGDSVAAAALGSQAAASEVLPASQFEKPSQ